MEDKRLMFKSAGGWSFLEWVRLYEDFNPENIYIGIRHNRSVRNEV